MLDRTQTRIVSPLERKAILVCATTKMWSARKLDRKVTQDTNAHYGAKEDAGRYNKLLIEKERLAKITTIIGKARTLLYSMSSPWANEGPRIMPNQLYESFSNQFRAMRQDFDFERDNFCAEYPTFYHAQKHRLGSMFDESDYPAPSEIRGMFSLTAQAFPMPSANDWRVEMDENTLSDLRAELQATNDALLRTSMQETKDKIIATVGNMATQLSKYDDGTKGRKIYDSLVGNVRKLVEILPAFNFENDPTFDSLIKRIETELCADDSDYLKENKPARDSVRKSADDIVEQVKGFFA